MAQKNILLEKNLNFIIIKLNLKQKSFLNKSSFLKKVPKQHIKHEKIIDFKPHDYCIALMSLYNLYGKHIQVCNTWIYISKQGIMERPSHLVDGQMLNPCLNMKMTCIELL
jgi:hypothetical protein